MLFSWCAAQSRNNNLQKVGSRHQQEPKSSRLGKRAGLWEVEFKDSRQGPCHIAWVSIAEPRGRLWLHELEDGLSVLLFMVHTLSFRQQTDS